MSAAPRIRLSFLFALTLIAALTTQNWLLNKQIQESRILLPGDVIALKVRGVLPRAPNSYIPTFEVADSNGRRKVSGWPITILADGTTSLPGIGKIQLAGLNLDEARSAIADSYSANGTLLDEADIDIESAVKRSVIATAQN